MIQLPPFFIETPNIDPLIKTLNKLVRPEVVCRDRCRRNAQMFQQEKAFINLVTTDVQ